MHVLSRQAVLCDGVTFLVLLKTMDKCQLAVTGKDTVNQCSRARITFPGNLW